MAQRIRVPAILLGLALLCILAYFPSLSLPLIADDYIQIMLGRQWGPVHTWADLATDPLYRCRATSIVLTWWIEKLFSVEPPVLKVTQLALHVIATWLVFAFGSIRQIGWKVSGVASAFFAVYEGHQEAVMWFAAVPEVLVFLFVLGSVLCWMLWLQGGAVRWEWLAAAMTCFVLALLSKESAAVVPALMAASAALYREHWRKAAAAIVPCGLITLGYAALIFAAQTNHLHFNDGTFSTKSNVAVTLMNSTGRLFWFWGLLSLATLIALRKRGYWPTVAACAIWIELTFLPYSFIAYMPRVPSRHTYLASAALAVVVAVAFVALRERMAGARRWIPAAVAAVIIAHNCGYLWIKKQEQYLERAAPTEELVELGRRHSGPIIVKCFPYGPELAQITLEQTTGHARRDVIIDASRRPAGAVEFCYENH